MAESSLFVTFADFRVLLSLSAIPPLPRRFIGLLDQKVTELRAYSPRGLGNPGKDTGGERAQAALPEGIE